MSQSQEIEKIMEYLKKRYNKNIGELMTEFCKLPENEHKFNELDMLYNDHEGKIWDKFFEYCRDVKQIELDPARRISAFCEKNDIEHYFFDKNNRDQRRNNREVYVFIGYSVPDSKIEDLNKLLESMSFQKIYPEYERCGFLEYFSEKDIKNNPAINKHYLYLDEYLEKISISELSNNESFNRLLEAYYEGKNLTDKVDIAFNNLQKTYFECKKQMMTASDNAWRTLSNKIRETQSISDLINKEKVYEIAEGISTEEDFNSNSVSIIDEKGKELYSGVINKIPEKLLKIKNCDITDYDDFTGNKEITIFGEGRNLSKKEGR